MGHLPIIASISTWLAQPKFFKRRWSRTEPDLDVIKQVDQVRTCVLAGACQDSEHRDQRGGSGSGIFNLIIRFADVWLQRTAKTAGRAGGTRLRRGSPAMPPALPGGSTNRAKRAAELLLCRIR